MAENDMHTTLEMIRTAGQGIAFTVQISRFAGGAAIHALKALLKAVNHIRTTGKQSYKTLNRTASRTGTPLGKPVDVPDTHAKQLIKTLKHYGVDFAIFDSPKGGQQVVVKAANIETLNAALEKTIAEAAQPRQSRFAEIMKSASEKAKRFNAARAAEAREVSHPARPAPVR